MLLENFLLDKLLDNDKKEGFEDSSSDLIKNIIKGVLELCLMIIAGYLAWDCNKSQGKVLRIVYTILSVIFSGIYIVFYLIYHKLIGVACK
jgi:hypothetical protein